MAFCANCGREMSDQAAACPNCGNPNQALQAALTDAPAAGNLAGFGQRFVAIIIDGLILGVVNYLVFKGNPYGSTATYFLYSWLLLGLNNGQTLGKRVMNVRVTLADGSPLNIGSAAARQAMAIVSSAAIGIGYLWAAWDKEKRTWHDMVANTRVFRTA